MTVVESEFCIFCGKPLDEHHQCVCADCVARYKQDHSQEFAEARLRYQLTQADSDKCIICGEPIHAVKGCVCHWCMDAIVEAEVKSHA